MTFLKNLVFSLLTLSFRNKVADKPVAAKTEVRKMSDLLELLIFSMKPIGSLEVYTIQERNDFLQSIPARQLFWRDAGSPQGHGPFTSVYGAMEHYKEFVQNLNKPKLLESGASTRLPTVVQVDFLRKKRI